MTTTVGPHWRVKFGPLSPLEMTADFGLVVGIAKGATEDKNEVIDLVAERLAHDLIESASLRELARTLIQMTENPPPENGLVAYTDEWLLYHRPEEVNREN